MDGCGMLEYLCPVCAKRGSDLCVAQWHQRAARLVVVGQVPVRICVETATKGARYRTAGVG